jgi:hypothetical protein
MNRPRRTLTPVTITERYPSFRTRKLETWAAKSDDGLWFYKREESPGTPWIVEHVPTGDWFLAGTLSEGRAATADGRALRIIEAQKRVAP